MTSKLQQQVTQTLAEAYNLLNQAELPLRGNQLQAAGNTMERFYAVVEALSKGSLVVAEPSEEEQEEKPDASE